MALVQYGAFCSAFRLWCDNLRGLQGKAEIGACMAGAARVKVAGHTGPAVLRAFLEADKAKHGS